MSRWIVSLLLLAGACKSEAPQPARPEPAPAIEEPEAESEEQPEPEAPQEEAVKWPTDFADIYERPLSSEDSLPECKSGWHASAIDDEFMVWKCSDYGDTGISESGELAIHTRNRKIFMVTVTVDQESDRGAKALVAPLRSINKEKSVEMTPDESKILDELWNLDTSYAGLTVGDTGFSVLHYSVRDQLSMVGELIERQQDLKSIGRRYTLDGFLYKIKRVSRESMVGRGKDRWTAMKGSDFVVVEYEIENRTKTLHDTDPATMRLVTGATLIESDERAQRAILDADRTGQLNLSLTPRKTRERVVVFEVPQSSLSLPLKLVVSNEDKLIFKVVLD